ncbi:MAG: hypothetical protein LQ338_007637 [Usnochroma carphineum]|nr:MAG: hypothetical protein LQ338_007637 [Usnochroma carphineum]
MSIDIDWEGLTTGSEGIILAKSIKDFIHEKFQQVQLPGFIRSVEVRSFEFGKECPVVELKDVCDPLSEFYEAEDDGSDDDGEAGHASGHEQSSAALRNTSEQKAQLRGLDVNPPMLAAPNRPLPIDTHFAGHRLDLSGSSTPGIPGGTSNLSYFHLPLSAGLSGTTTPLAAVAGGGPLTGGWSDTHFAGPYSHLRQHSPVRQWLPRSPLTFADPSSRPSTADSYAQPHEDINGADDGPQPLHEPIEPDPSDVQIVLHISYSGSVRLSITAEILLDYPMPSFVGIPLKLNITGLSFDGVALIAYLRKRAHFCFLAPEDARTLVGSEVGERSTSSREEKGNGGLGGLLREIQVESEIGRQEGGKQVLKNVGKVEKFVLEQVRRIFEEEFVWPSFWTFLV